MALPFFFWVLNGEVNLNVCKGRERLRSTRSLLQCDPKVKLIDCWEKYLKPMAQEMCPLESKEC